MKKIGKFLDNNPRYKRLQKPLEAAEVCERARAISEGRFEVISFRNGLLTIACSSPAQAANLQTESQEIIDKINSKLGESKVKRMRFKIN